MSAALSVRPPAPRRAPFSRGTVRLLACPECGSVGVELWTGAGSCDFRCQIFHSDGVAVPVDHGDLGCTEHPTHPRTPGSSSRSRGPCGSATIGLYPRARRAEAIADLFGLIEGAPLPAFLGRRS